MSNLFRFIPISQLADKFPEGSWWAKFYQDFSDEQLAAYYEGDLTLPSLNLDWEQPFPQQKEVIIIFIEGNFTVDNLYNKETDGAIGLLVTGNLSAKNIAVGGQEIYVSGNLMIEEILCGSFNHGETIVKGDLSAAVLVQDDEYSFKVDGHKSIACLVNVWEGDGVFQRLPVDIHEVLIDEVFLDMDEDEEDFSFATLVNVIKEGRSALKKINESPTSKNAVHLYFIHNTINEENILKLTQCILMPSDKPSFNFREQDVFFKVQLEHIDADGDERDLSVYMNDNRHHYYIWLEQDHSVGLLKRNIKEGSEWEDITEESQEQLAEISDCWTMLLTCVNMAELYLRNIEVQYVQDILQHTAIQGLYSEVEENGGFWDGSKCYSFRQTHTDEDGDLLHGRVEIRTPDEAYYFYTLDNGTYVSRHYQPPDQYGKQDMPYLDLRRWEASERYFTRFKQFITEKIESGVNS
ncbi:hypothetical protein BSK66_02440 [Paenibacillus odorifer]|jgi:hypothetical protein|uniref:Uncharacterized protein n=1 Tax=Paenibacillus odorifer TaxID=189426 RepID=A0A1R0X9Z0_9BACL|nr:MULTISPECIES: hypothetical protein [Paenibacillus]ETT46064.1 hypothetical protein C171_30529 [Paenibacillus sp. FSL H8-237]OMD31626.1 hypothetical protein BJP51_17480 [Paenibacillus odorifer]OME63562.1 hypothetical protein BSK66_02440 [Paenibacillus odorifer]